MRPRKVKRGNTVYEMRAKKNGSQTPAPGQAVSLAKFGPEHTLDRSLRRSAGVGNGKPRNASCHPFVPPRPPPH
jgi:hypothetical protein